MTAVTEVKTCVWRHDETSCSPDVEARGLCHIHYQRAYFHGLLDHYPRMSRERECVRPGDCLGSTGGYAQGCRGTACNEANTIAARERMKRMRERQSAAVPRVVGSLGPERACIGQNEVFFPTITERIEIGQLRWCSPRPGRAGLRVDPWAAARAICLACPVRDECLERALSLGRTAQRGFEGGLDPWERVQMIRQRYEKGRR